MELLLGKIKNGFPIARETRMNEGFVTCYTLEDTIAISEPVMVGQYDLLVIKCYLCVGEPYTSTNIYQRLPWENCSMPFLHAHNCS